MAQNQFTSIKPTPHQQFLSNPCRTEREVSSYAKLLMDLTSCLSDMEYSQLRLALCVDSHLKQSKQRYIHNVADLFEYMNNKKLITRTNLKMLHALLKQISREDLRSKVKEYEENHVVSLTTDLNNSVCRNRPVRCVEDEKEKCQRFPESLDSSSLEEDDLPGSQDSMKSLSDDEKLLRAGQAFPEKFLFEQDDIHMSSQGSN